MKTLTFSFLLFFSFFNIHAQELAGRKIVQGSLGLNFNSSDFGSRNSYNATVLYGKIRENNTYLAWGGAFSGATNKNVPTNEDNQNFQVGPAAEFGKFIPLVDRFYLAPQLGGSAQAAFGSMKGVYINAYASPLRFLYHFSNNFMMSASFGSASLKFSRVEDITQFSLNGSLSNSTGFGVFYTFK